LFCFFNCHSNPPTLDAIDKYLYSAINSRMFIYIMYQF
jgi:hypothetical protein